MYSWIHNLTSKAVPYKVQNCSGNLRKGVAVKSLADFVKKSQKALQIFDTDKIVLESDGTEVDDEEYFQTLPPQTVFVLLRQGESWRLDKSKALHTVISALDHNASSDVRSELLSQLQKLLKSSTEPPQISLLTSMTNHLETNVHVTSRDEDEDWFNGIEARFKKKEDVLKESARRRIRSYYYTAKDYVKTNTRKDKDTAQMMTLLLDCYKTLLKQNDYYGHYFGRSDADSQQESFCDVNGWFRCEGAFTEDACDVRHLLNPYASRSDRIVFSTWNLDHQIEKSREVLPSLWKAVSGLRENARLKINNMYFYNLLFTRVNLRLVHITCHDKKEHSDAICDTDSFYL